MSRGRTGVVKNSGILLAVEVVTKIIEVILTVAVARVLGPDGLGVMAFAVSFASLFSILAVFGLPSLLARNVARDEAAFMRYLGNSLVLKAGLGVIATFLIWVTAMALRLPGAKLEIVMLAALLMVVETTLMLVAAFFRAFQRAKYEAVMMVFAACVSTATGLAVLWLGGDLSALLRMRLLAYGGALVLGLVMLHRKFGPLRLSWRPAEAWALLKASSHFALFQVFVAIYVQIDMVLLPFMKGDLMTGWYAAAQKFRKVFTFIPLSIQGAIVPALSRSVHHSREEFVQTARRAWKYLFLMAFPIAMGISMLADRLIPLLFGAAYGPSVPALRIVIWTIVFAFINVGCTAVLVAVDRERQVSRNLACGAVFNLLTNLVCIPRWGHIGASITTVASEALVFVLHLRTLRLAVPELQPLRAIPKPCLVAAVMGGVVWSLQTIMPLPALIGMGVLVYAAGVLWTGALEREELAFIGRLVRRVLGRGDSVSAPRRSAGMALGRPRRGLPAWGVRHVTFPLQQLRHDRRVLDRLRELERTQWLKEPALEELQQRSLRRTLQAAAFHVPHYRHQCRQHGVDVAAEDSLRELQKLPVLSKTVLQSEADQLLRRNGWRHLKWHQTSGSTGQPVRVAVDLDAADYQKAASLRGRAWWNLGVGSRQLWIWGRDEFRDGRSHWRDWLVENKRVLPLWKLSERTVEEFHDHIRQFRPHYLYGYASGLTELARLMQAAGLPGAALQLRGVIVTAEMLPLPHRQLLRDAFQAPIISEYGCAEVQVIAFECPAGSLHINAETVLVECLEHGRIVLTDLHNRAMPLLRYEVGDVGRLLSGRCACGRSLPRMDLFVSRSCDMVRLADGRTIHPEVFTPAHDHLLFQAMGQFRVIQRTPSHFTVQVVSRQSDVQQIQREFTRFVAQQLGQGIALDFEFLPDIPRDPSGKLRYFISELSDGRTGREA